MRLVTAWLEFRATQDKSKSESVRYLNASLGRHDLPSRIWEWEHGPRQPPDEVVKFMREELLPVLLKEANFSPGDRKKVLHILEDLL